MSIPCPVSMLPAASGGGKTVAFVIAALVVLAIAANSSAQPALPAQPK